MHVTTTIPTWLERRRKKKSNLGVVHIGGFHDQRPSIHNRMFYGKNKDAGVGRKRRRRNLTRKKEIRRPSAKKNRPFTTWETKQNRKNNKEKKKFTRDCCWGGANMDGGRERFCSRRHLIMTSINFWMMQQNRSAAKLVFTSVLLARISTSIRETGTGGGRWRS